MKALLAIFVLTVVFALPATAQYETTFYRDSLNATGVTSSATHTRGYDTFVRLRSDAVSFIHKQLSIKFTKTTDSVKIQGAKVNFGQDTTWEDIPVTTRLVSAINTGGGSSISRDTTAYWITPVGTGLANYTGHNPGSTGILDIPPGYRAYRVVSGKNDSGYTYIQSAWIRNR